MTAVPVARRLAADHVTREYGAASPRASLIPGERLVVQVRDGGDSAFADRAQGSSPLNVEAVAWDRFLPLTGPIWIEGARPGDTLAVDVLDIATADRAWTGFVPAFSRSVLKGEVQAPAAVTVSAIEGGEVVLAGGFRLPAKPMIGCIGVAPAGAAVGARTPGRHGGNMDASVVARGSRVYFPVAREGALLALGDLHATMGDGEIGGSGAECAGEVTLACEVLRGGQLEGPLVETEAAWYLVESGASMDSAARRVVRSALSFLQRVLGTSVGQASVLASIGCHLQVCQIVNPHITLRMRVPKHLVPDASHWVGAKP